MIRFGKATREHIAGELKVLFEENPVMFITNFQGLSVNKIEQLRKTLKKNPSTDYMVVKNSMARIAAKQLNMDFLVPYFEGTCGVVFSGNTNDVIELSRLLIGFSKENDGLKVCCGALSKRFIDIANIKEFALLPTREVLLAKVVGGMKAPLLGFVGVLNNALGGFVRVVDAIAKKR